MSLSLYIYIYIFIHMYTTGRDGGASKDDAGPADDAARKLPAGRRAQRSNARRA